MTRLIRTELLKLSTIRMTWGLLAVAAALSALFASLEASRAGNGNSGVPPITTATGLLTVTTVTGFGMLEIGWPLDDGWWRQCRRSFWSAF